MKILLIGGKSNSLVNFRGHLIQAIIDRGHQVIACGGESNDQVAEKLRSWGAIYIPLKIDRAGMSPFGDLCFFINLLRIMRLHRPCVVLSYTIKPVIWGGIAAKALGIENIYSMITGLGYAFVSEQHSNLVFDSEGKGNTRNENNGKQKKIKFLKAKKFPKRRIAKFFAKKLYGISLKFSKLIFFQNPDDQNDFVQWGLAEHSKTVVTSGSGVDLSYYSKKNDCDKIGPFGQDIPCANPINEKRNYKSPVLSFLLIARLLKDKGINEFAKAGKIIKKDFPNSEFHLVGNFDSNPNSFKRHDIEIMQKENGITFHGFQANVLPLLRKSHIYVLPSYREGTPRTVLEAMAVGLPIITTDVPGCRETVRLTAKGQAQKQNNLSVMEGENGYLVKPGDAEAVAKAMRTFIENPDLINKMGFRSREIAIEKFDVQKVNNLIMNKMGLL